MDGLFSATESFCGFRLRILFALKTLMTSSFTSEWKSAPRRRLQREFGKASENASKVMRPALKLLSAIHHQILNAPMNSLFYSSIFTAFALISLALASAQETPRLLPFQARLTEANGNALADGSKVVQFKIYDAPVGGQAVWSGEVQKLTVNGGLVNTILGPKASLGSVDFNKSLYLELTMDANDDGQITAAAPPMLPRQSILPAVFAKESANSKLLDGYDWSALF